MKNFLSKGLSKIWLFVILLIIAISIIQIASAAPGAYCEESPCTCGSACQNGGYEISNGFNTIDSCQDGPEDAYEYVHDVTATDLGGGGVFLGGDTVTVDAYLQCDSDGDEFSLVYNNGTSWKSFYDNTCSIIGKKHYYVNLTLDNVEGDHSTGSSVCMPLWSIFCLK